MVPFSTWRSGVHDDPVPLQWNGTPLQRLPELQEAVHLPRVLQAVVVEDKGLVVTAHLPRHPVAQDDPQTPLLGAANKVREPQEELDDRIWWK